MEIIILAMVLGVIVGMIASSKGHSFFPWWIYGTLLFIVAIVHVLLIKPDSRFQETEALSAGGKKCPMCAEIVKSDALVCRFCSHKFEINTVAAASTKEQAFFKDQVG